MVRMNNLSTASGTRITRRREERGWTKAELAKRANCAPSYITKIEAGKIIHPSMEKVRDIAVALGVPVTELIETTAPPTPGDVSGYVERIMATNPGTAQSVLRKLAAEPRDVRQAMLEIVDRLLDTRHI